MSAELGSAWAMSKSVEEKRWNCREKRHIMKKNAERRDDNEEKQTQKEQCKRNQEKGNQNVNGKKQVPFCPL